MKKPKLNELKSIHEWIRETSNAEISFVSLLVFPLFISFYSWAIKMTGLDDFKIWIFLGITVFYILSILIMKNSQTNNEEMEIDLLIIKNHSKTFKIEHIGLDKLKEKDSKFNEIYLKKLIRKFPNELIIANFDDNKKVGIKILKFSQLMLPQI
jgi:low affinity Fe/Cu permease